MSKKPDGTALAISWHRHHLGSKNLGGQQQAEHCPL
jgi:hypothetical protein